MRISSLTASNFHSLITFLYASDLSDQEIHQEVWKIRSLIQLNPILENDEFSSDLWAKSS